MWFYKIIGYIVLLAGVTSWSSLWEVTVSLTEHLIKPQGVFYRLNK